MLNPTPAFTYEVRGTGGPAVEAFPGSGIALDERHEYLLRFAKPASDSAKRVLDEAGGDFLRDDLAVVSFRNFVGRTAVAGVSIDVESTKVGPKGVSRILEEVSVVSSGLVFGRRSPVAIEGGSTDPTGSPVPYHQLQFLREAMLRRPVGQRVQDHLQVIERNPTRRFESDRRSEPIGSVRRLDVRSLQTIASELGSLAPLPVGARVRGSPLAQKLTFGVRGRPHFPVKVNTPRGRLSFDTPENRFVRHVLSECLALVHRFVAHRGLHDQFRTDCRTMISMLEPVASAPFVADATRLAGLGAPSQALAKAPGYRELFSFWNDLTRHVSFPPGAGETVRLLAGRNMAALYEYWVFAKILKVSAELVGVGPSKPPAILHDEWGERLAGGVVVHLGPYVSVAFNPTFSRSRRNAYSTPLRPDVVLRIDDYFHAFDAKYRLNRIDTGEEDTDDGQASYRRADLYKMHTYRDAIERLRTAFAVYPGTEFAFFERHGGLRTAPADVASADGVGALPLRPADDAPEVGLRGLLEVLFRSVKRSP